MAEETASVEDQIIDQVLGPDIPDETPDPVPTPTEDEIEPETAPEDGQEGDEFVDIEYEGKVYAVPPELKDAFSRTADYTQKTQAVASERKEIEVQREMVKQAQDQYKFAQSIQQEAAELQTLDYQITQYRDYMRTNIDALSGTELEKIRLYIEDAKFKKDELTGKLQSKWQEHQQAQQQSVKELLDKSTEVLRQKIPKWSESLDKEVTEYARSVGFSDDEVKSAKFDPRQIVMAHKAMLYDKLQEGKVTTLQKLGTKPAIRAKTRDPMPANVRKRLDLKNKLNTKDLSEADKARLIGEDLADFALQER